MTSELRGLDQRLPGTRDRAIERRIVEVRRDCATRLVPTGDPASLKKGDFVTLVQAMGGSYTVVSSGNMMRIEPFDADAIGFEAQDIRLETQADGSFGRHEVEAVLRTVYDPEIPVNILDLGLIYDCEVTGRDVRIEMTLTAPGCGMGPVLVDDIVSRLKRSPNVGEVTVELVFDPPWARERMSEEAQLQLGLY